MALSLRIILPVVICSDIRSDIFSVIYSGILYPFLKRSLQTFRLTEVVETFFCISQWGYPPAPGTRSKHTYFSSMFDAVRFLYENHGEHTFICFMCIYWIVWHTWGKYHFSWVKCFKFGWLASRIGMTDGFECFRGLWKIFVFSRALRWVLVFARPSQCSWYTSRGEARIKIDVRMWSPGTTLNVCWGVAKIVFAATVPLYPSKNDLPLSKLYAKFFQ